MGDWVKGAGGALFRYGGVTEQLFHHGLHAFHNEKDSKKRRRVFDKVSGAKESGRVGKVTGQALKDGDLGGSFGGCRVFRQSRNGACRWLLMSGVSRGDARAKLTLGRTLVALYRGCAVCCGWQLRRGSVGRRCDVATQL